MPKTLGVVVEEDLLHKLEAIASKENRSMSNVIETLLFEAFNHRDIRTMEEKRGDSNENKAI